MHACIISDTFLYIFEIRNMTRLMLRNVIGRVTGHPMSDICVQKYM